MYIYKNYQSEMSDEMTTQYVKYFSLVTTMSIAQTHADNLRTVTQYQLILEACNSQK